MKNNKRAYLNIFIPITILLLAMTICAALLCPATVAYAASNLNYNAIIYIGNNVDGGYKYWNYGGEANALEADSIVAVFDDVKAHTAAGSVISVNFSNVVCDENLILAERSYVFDGWLHSTADSYPTAVFTVKSGASLTIAGLEVISFETAVTTESGSNFKMVSGLIEVNYQSSLYIGAAIYIKGDALITGGTVIYTGTSSGVAIDQSAAGSNLTIRADSPVLLRGDSACSFRAGVATIESGTFEATHETMAGVHSESGSAVKVSTAACVTVKGGIFRSVTPSNAVLLRGDADSSFTFEGGTIEGNIRLVPLNKGTQFIVGDRIVTSSSCAAVVAVPYSGDELTISNIVLRVEVKTGYKFDGWLTNEPDLITNNPISLSELPTGEITVTANDEYIVPLEIAGLSMTKIFRYNEVHTSAELEAFAAAAGVKCPNNYTIVGWSKDGAPATSVVTVTGTETLVAILQLVAPVISSDISDLECVYEEGVSHTITAEATHPISPLSYIWEKEGTGIVGSSSSLTVGNVSDSGVYKLTISVTDIASFGTYTAMTVKSVKVNIGKADSVPAQITLSGVYSSAKTLGTDYPLPTGYAWVEPNRVPVVNVKEYAVTYIKDAENYNSANFSVALNITKAKVSDEYSVPPHNSLPTVTYDKDKNLGYYKSLLAAHYYWIDETEVPVCNKSAYAACYNPDPDNYVTEHNVDIYFNINKANILFVADVELSVHYFDGLTLYSVNEYLPEHFRINDTNADLKNIYDIGAYGKVKLIYNPDRNNYNDYNNALLDLTIDKGILFVPDNIPTFTKVYNPDIKVKNYLFDSPYWMWNEEDGEIVPTAGEHTYRAWYDPRPTHYYPLEVNVPFTVIKAIPDDYDHSYALSPVTYRKGLKLEDLSLANGYAWINPDTVLTAGVGDYPARYTKDNDNYDRVDLTIKVTVNKADCEFIGESNQIFVYDGTVKEADVALKDNEQTLVSNIENTFINVGVYTIVFTVDESDNYNAGEFTVTVTIRRNTVNAATGGISVSIVDKISGFADAINLQITVITKEKLKLTISIATEANISGADIFVTLSDDYNISKLNNVSDVAGNALKYEVIDVETGIVRFGIAEAGDITFEFDEEDEPLSVQPNGSEHDDNKDSKPDNSSLEPWAIALICIAGLTVVVIMVCVTLIITAIMLKKKRGYGIKGIDAIVDKLTKKSTSEVTFVNEEAQLTAADASKSDIVAATDVSAADIISNTDEPLKQENDSENKNESEDK